MNDLVFKNAQLVLPNEVVKGSLSVVDGRIAAVAETIAPSSAKQVLSAKGKLVTPGLIDTPIYGQGEGSEAFKANLEKGVLFPHRLGFPDELASMVVECVTNSYMNAETIRVDGGIRMPPK